MNPQNRSLNPIYIAVALCLLLTLWMSTGMWQSDSDTLTTEPIPQEAREEKPLFKVQVARMEAENAPLYLNLNGSMTYLRETTLSAEISGSVSRIDTPKGQAVEKGRQLVALNEDDRPDRLAKSRAELIARESDVRATRALIGKNMASDNQLKQEEARLAEARADLKKIELEIDRITVHAPFSGIVEDMLVEEGEFVTPGQPLVRLIDNSKLKLVAQVPQQEVHKLKLGQPMSATLPEGSLITGAITYIAATANPKTKTFQIEGIVDQGSPSTQYGKSASIRIDLGTTKAYKLSPSLLGLDAKGQLYVKGITHDSVVMTYPVDIIRSEADGIWLKGLPEAVTLITRGQGYVAEGQKVAPFSEKAMNGGDAS